MEKINAREIFRDCFTLFIYIVGFGRNLRVNSEDRKRLCTCRCAAPFDLRALIGAKCSLTLAESIFGWNHRAMSDRR